ELVGIAVECGSVQAHELEQFARAGFGLRARLPAGDRAVADDAADRVPRIERCERILKDHLDLFAQRTELAFGQPRDVAPVEDHLAAIDADQLEQAFSYRGLARSGLAHDAQCLAAPDSEADAVDCAHGALAPQPAPAG